MIAVRGAATPEEVAALLAALRDRPAAPDDDPYERWRAGRIAALRSAIDRAAAPRP